LFAGDGLPAALQATDSIEEYYQLAVTLTTRARDAKVVAADMEQRTIEYRAETERLTSILQRCGVVPAG
jgi:hypothetical protein